MTEKGILAHLHGLYHIFRNFPNFLMDYIEKDHDFLCLSDISHGFSRLLFFSNTAFPIGLCNDKQTAKQWLLSKYPDWINKSGEARNGKMVVAKMNFLGNTYNITTK